MLRKVLFIFAPLTLAAQAPTPAAPPAAPIAADTVVATSEGVKITAGEVRKIVDMLPGPMKQNYQGDPKGFLNQWLLLKKLVKVAETEKLAEKSPYKEGLELNRMQVLFQAAMDDHQSKLVIPEEEQKKYYEAKKDSHLQANLKLIYVPFVASPQPGAANQRNEKDALARAEEAVKKGRSGADFAALVKEYSEDPISKEKGGDFGPVKRGDNLPDAVKQAIFQLKKDEISEPVRQPNGYYVFRLVSLTAPGFEELRDTLYRELKNERLRLWMDGNMKSVEPKIERPDFFQPSAAR